MSSFFSSDETEQLIVTSTEAGERLDKILAARYLGRQSRSYFQFLIEEGALLLNGQHVKKRTLVAAGDEIEVCFLLTPEINLTPEAIPLDIVFEDAHLLVVNKPAGMVVHPAPGHWSGTFANALLYHCQESASQLLAEQPLRPGIVHRLDKDTSGLLIAAKSILAHQKLIELFASRQMEKRYVAVCAGQPGQGRIEARIGRHPVRRKEMAVVAEGGKEALTFFETIATNGQVSVVAVLLATGRTHQIRVHLKHHGTPILGDPLYGSSAANQKYKVERPLLHAAKLKFMHPITGQLLELAAPPPADIQKWISHLAEK